MPKNRLEFTQLKGGITTEVSTTDVTSEFPYYLMNVNPNLQLGKIGGYYEDASINYGGQASFKANVITTYNFDGINYLIFNRSVTESGLVADRLYSIAFQAGGPAVSTLSNTRFYDLENVGQSIRALKYSSNNIPDIPMFVGKINHDFFGTAQPNVVVTDARLLPLDADTGTMFYKICRFTEMGPTGGDYSVAIKYGDNKVYLLYDNYVIGNSLDDCDIELISTQALCELDKSGMTFPAHWAVYDKDETESGTVYFFTLGPSADDPLARVLVLQGSLPVEGLLLDNTDEQNITDMIATDSHIGAHPSFILWFSVYDEDTDGQFKCCYKRYVSRAEYRNENAEGQNGNGYLRNAQFLWRAVLTEAGGHPFWVNETSVAVVNMSPCMKATDDTVRRHGRLWIDHEVESRTEYFWMEQFRKPLLRHGYSALGHGGNDGYEWVGYLCNFYADENDGNGKVPQVSINHTDDGWMTLTISGLCVLWCSSSISAIDYNETYTNPFADSNLDTTSERYVRAGTRIYLSTEELVDGESFYEDRTARNRRYGKDKVCGVQNIDYGSPRLLLIVNGIAYFYDYANGNLAPGTTYSWIRSLNHTSLTTAYIAGIEYYIIKHIIGLGYPARPGYPIGFLPIENVKNEDGVFFQNGYPGLMSAVGVNPKIYRVVSEQSGMCKLTAYFTSWGGWSTVGFSLIQNTGKYYFIEPSGTNAIGIRKGEAFKYYTCSCYDGNQYSPLSPSFGDTVAQVDDEGTKITIYLNKNQVDGGNVMSKRVTDLLVFKSRVGGISGSYESIPREIARVSLIDKTGVHERFGVNCYRIIVKDKNELGATYQDISGFSHLREITTPYYAVQHFDGSSLYIGKCSGIENFEDADRVIFKSFPGRPDQFDLYGLFRHLPNVPTFISDWGKDLLCFTNTAMHILDKETLDIKHTFEGVHAVSVKKLVDGVYICTYDDIYFYNGQLKKISGNLESGDFIYKDEAFSEYPPVIEYNQKEDLRIITLVTGSRPGYSGYALCFTASHQVFPCTLRGHPTASYIDFDTDNVVICSPTENALMFDDRSRYRPFNYKSQMINFGSNHDFKKFYSLFLAFSDPYVPSSTGPSAQLFCKDELGITVSLASGVGDGNVANYAIGNTKHKAIQIEMRDIPGDKIIDSFGLIYRQYRNPR